MPRRIVILDTSIFCCWLEIPGKETAGSGDEMWNYERVAHLLQEELETRHATLVLPLAAVIEIGGHIAHADRLRFEKAKAFGEHLKLAVGGEAPWAAFTQQADLWKKENIERLADAWPALAAAKLSLADATMGDVADYYSRTGFEVFMLSADNGLCEYASTLQIQRPRRRVAEI